MKRAIKVSDYEVSYDVSRRDVKYPRLEFKTGDLVLVLPRAARNEEEIIRRHIRWIRRKSDFIKRTLGAAGGDNRSYPRGDEEFRSVVTSAVEKSSDELGSKPLGTYFRAMRSKWASMSARGNLTINTLMRRLPARLISYVVYHEIAHLKERKHNDNFRRIIERKYKNRQIMEKDLFKYWFLVNSPKHGCSSAENARRPW